MSVNLLRLPQVLERTGLRRANLYARIKRGEFPKPVSLGNGGRSVAWLSSEIEEWINHTIANARSNGGAQ
jgi:prophage regulatory protein